jgi:hypothetical protein
MSSVLQTVVDEEMMYEFVDEADETDDVEMVDIDVFDSDQIVARKPSDRKTCHKCLKVQTKKRRAWESCTKCCECYCSICKRSSICC